MTEPLATAASVPIGPAAVVTLVALALLVVLILVILRVVLRQRPAEFIESVGRLLSASDDRQSELLRNEFRGVRQEISDGLGVTRKELAESIERSRTSSVEAQQAFERTVQEKLDKFSDSLIRNTDRTSNVLGENRKELVETLEKRLQAVDESVAGGLKEMSEKNEQKLEQMRETVDEKLQKTLEQRLTQSFELVSNRLLEVQKGLTEMQTLAQDVGGLKKALTNIKVRGMLGETQLGALLEQFLSREQYDENVQVRPRSGERVEFAVKLPGTDVGEHVWLPVDSKFPIEDYQRLQEALDTGDKPALEAAGKAFETRIVGHAKEIASKYIDVPNTTDFALMFLPFEGIYAEAIRRPGLFEQLQRTHHVTMVGPTTLAAFLNSLQVGFKTLAISRQSSEVWKILGAVKTEFGKFGTALGSVQKNLETATSNLSKVSTRARAMERKLGAVTDIPAAETAKLLPADDGLLFDGADDSDEDNAEDEKEAVGVT